MTATMAHRVLADWILTGALIWFGLAIVAALVWAELDRRRSLGGSRNGVDRLIRPLENRRERW